MRSLIRNLILVVAVLVISVVSIIPPQKKLRLGKDLRGGVSLVYSVQLKPGDPPDVIPKVIEVLKDRVDPNGLSEISITQQGRDRLEITMPLPSDRVKKLKQAYEAALSQLTGSVLDPATFERLMRESGAAREAEIARVAAGNTKRLEALKQAAVLGDAAKAVRLELNQAQADLKTAKDTGADAARLAELTKKVDELVGKTADAEIAYDKQKAVCLAAAVNPLEVRRAMELSDDSRVLTDAANQQVRLPSPRKEALDRLRSQFPDYADQINRVVAAYAEYAKERTRLDDSADLKKLLAGAGVLDFRITVGPGEHPQESRLRRELRERGPQNVQSTDARWYKVNKIDNWIDHVDDALALKQSPSAYFSGRFGLTVEEYGGECYVLCWDVPGSRLTKAEGEWKVASAYQSTDPQSGLPAISFEMNNRGASLLNDLTKQHVGKHMAVLLDDQVYTAPNLRSKIGRSGQITGSFSDSELRYIIRVLAAGSLQARLSPEPISESTMGPELGADNLRKSFKTGIIAMALVAMFMILYYFTSGLIAVLAVIYNFIFVLGIMSLNQAAFTVPGIAGIVLTFGQAVDSNVLIYERMREEFNRGADMRTAVRLGFSRALSPIMDGNISNLIICAVLYFFGTQEIKGFAITLSVGVLTTLFTALVLTRLIFDVLVDHVGWSRTSQLPMAVPAVQRWLTPHVDWMKHRGMLLGILVVFLLASAVMIWYRGADMLSPQFRGGTEVGLQFKGAAGGQPATLTRKEVQDRVSELAKNAKPTDPVWVLSEAEVLPVNPQQDGVTSDKFTIRFGHAPDEKAVLGAITNRFSDVMESRLALGFEGVNNAEVRAGPVHQILSKTLGENVGRPDLRDDVSAYLGGVAIMLQNLEPPPTKQSLGERLDEMRQRSEYADSLSRQREVRVLEGTDAAVKTAVILVKDEVVSAFGELDRWERSLAGPEWALTRDALTRASQLANAQTFSPQIAGTFKAQAVISTLLSLLILTIYVWVRFGTARWAIAATLPLFADVIGIVGLIAVAELIYDHPATNGFARTIGLLPFKLDVDQIAALLTIVGYSLNDKIIILDRIRENKGKMPYASYSVINDSINQTLSRTIITAGAHMITTIVLYVWGGEAVRGFAYTFNLGVLLGTYTSIVSTPLVWSRKAEDMHKSLPPSPDTPHGGASATPPALVSV